MKRFVGLLSAALLAGSVAVFAPSSPASADICVGFGTATVATPGLQYPVVGQYRVLGFVFNFTTGVCTNNDSVLYASGTLQGYCGHSTGSGTDTDGHTAQWTTAGLVLVLSGEITGVVLTWPNIPAGESCNPPAGTLNFLVAGAVMRQNCGPMTSTSGLTTLMSDSPVTGGDLSIHHSVHACFGAQL